MRLSDITAVLAGAERYGPGDPDITGIACDSRDTAPGFLFAAMPGNRDDGQKYVPEAVARGAVAVILPAVPAADPGVPYIVAGDSRRAVGEAAAALYANPSQVLELYGITGTNGKTTTAYLLRHMFTTAGWKTGMMGTIEYDLGDSREAAPLTTPDPVRFTRSLAAMRDAGCRAAVVEVSSHALAQERTHPHRFAGAVFTNLTRDHLDYHGDMDGYAAAKRKLFLGLDESAVAVMNFRDPAAARLAAGCRANVVGYSLSDNVAIVASSLDGQEFVLTGGSGDGAGECRFRTPIVGRYNVENCCGAILLARAAGVPDDVIAAALASFPGVPGRMERILSSDGVTAFVDYAHTDDSLRSAVSVLRPLVRGKLITVFGCGGDRDTGKRPLMAKAAEELSDRIVVTSDNPRTEDPERIIDAIMTGFSAPDTVIRLADRPSAIRRAVALAGPGDAILVAGKGHEDYQILGTTKHHMDDRELVREAFSGRRGERT